MARQINIKVYFIFFCFRIIFTEFSIKQVNFTIFDLTIN
jgi:hypothetical protein